ncbi:MAG: dTMP kinase [Ruminococcaceae bacterium]|nr:dTMP kinase [Oscillospiraceae bacterium]
MKNLKMRKNTTPGVLISFCGLDGCGKTTMIKLLNENLKGDFDVMLTKQPTDFVRKSDIFRTYMDSPDHDAYDYRSLSLLAASDRVQHVNKFILPELEKGRTVITDRYYYSCLANLRARGYTGDKWIYEISRSVVKPDIAFFLDVPVEVSVSRVRSRKDEKDRFIDMDLQYKLKKEYVDICHANGGILISSDTSVEDTYEKVIAEIRRFSGGL